MTEIFAFLYFIFVKNNILSSKNCFWHIFRNKEKNRIKKNREKTMNSACIIVFLSSFETNLFNLAQEIGQIKVEVVSSNKNIFYLFYFFSRQQGFLNEYSEGGNTRGSTVHKLQTRCLGHRWKPRKEKTL